MSLCVILVNAIMPIVAATHLKKLKPIPGRRDRLSRPPVLRRDRLEAIFPPDSRVRPPQSFRHPLRRFTKAEGRTPAAGWRHLPKVLLHPRRHDQDDARHPQRPDFFPPRQELPRLERFSEHPQSVVPATNGSGVCRIHRRHLDLRPPRLSLRRDQQGRRGSKSDTDTRCLEQPGDNAIKPLGLF